MRLCVYACLPPLSYRLATLTQHCCSRASLPPLTLTPINQPTHTHTQEDLLAELDALVEEETEAKLTEVPGALPAKPGKVAAAPAPAGVEQEAALLPDMPAVPTTKPAVPSSAVAVRGMWVRVGGELDVVV